MSYKNKELRLAMCRIYNRESYVRNKEKRKLKMHEWYLANNEKKSCYNKEYLKQRVWTNEELERKRVINLSAYHRNKGKNVKEIRSKINRRYLETPSIRINATISSCMRRSLKGGKGGQSWESLVGYTLQDLMAHLESQFKEGMSWDNYGVLGWHVDHIKPLSWFDYSLVDDQAFKECWSLDNLQPLWAKDNLSKGNRYAG